MQALKSPWNRIFILRINTTCNRPMKTKTGGRLIAFMTPPPINITKH